MIKSTFKLTEAELYKGLVAITKSNWLARVFQVIGGIMVLSQGYTLYSYVANGLWPSFFSVFFFLMGFYSLFMAEIANKFQVSSLLKKNAPITEETTVTFDETGFHLVGESYSTYLNYNKLHEVRETRNFLLLRVSERSANLLPKRAISDDQLLAIKNILKSIPGLKLKLAK